MVTDAAGNVLISGYTQGSLDGQPYAGGSDAFVSKYDTSGNLLWTRQQGTSNTDVSKGVAVDAAAHVFISGYTNGDLDGTNAGSDDAFVSKYDTSGSFLWTRQLGTADQDISQAVAADADGSVFISGYTNGDLDGFNAGGYDAFVTKYNASGSLLWTRQLGKSNNERSYGVAADVNGDVLISGYTYSRLDGNNAGSSDAFVSKYDTSGNLLWTRQLGTSGPDKSWGVATDAAGNVFITGDTTGSLGGANAGNTDAFVSKYDTSGNLVWTRQQGTSGNDISLGVTADSAGNVFITGYTFGSLGGLNAGDWDAFVSKYDTSGSLLWTRQLGTSAWDQSCGVTADAAGNVFSSGQTDGDLDGLNAGWTDGFIVKFNVPEPTTMGLLALGGLALLTRRK